MSEPRTLVVEGWRFIPHSYAIVNQYLCLELLKRPDIRLFHRDVPFVAEVRGAAPLWPPETERLLRDIPPPPPDLKPDALLRTDWPHRFDNDPAAARTFVWGTTEFKMVENSAIPTWQPAREILPHIKSTVIACSAWARAGFVNSGAPPERVHIALCGADPDQFHPATPAARDALRKELGWDGKLVLLNVSSMSENKGIPLLLKAAAKLAGKFPNLLVALKGVDAMYQSAGHTQKAMAGLSPAEANAVRPRLWYAGEVLTAARVAALYQAADLYVSPYLAEGFNLPALEAVASGLPSLCTRGGPTDEFLSEEIASRINSYEKAYPDGRRMLVPNPVHLGELLIKWLSNAPLRERAATAGPAWVRDRFTWRHSVDQMLKIMFPP